MYGRKDENLESQQGYISSDRSIKSEHFTKIKARGLIKFIVLLSIIGFLCFQLFFRDRQGKILKNCRVNLTLF